MEDGAWGSDEVGSPDDPAVTAAAATVADIVDASSGVAALAVAPGTAAAGGGRTYRPSATRPVLKLSVSLIDTYKQINKIYYDARARQREAEAEGGNRGGMYNNGYDDQHYDYILHADEVFAGRYILKHKIGKVRKLNVGPNCHWLPRPPPPPPPPPPLMLMHPLSLSLSTRARLAKSYARGTRSHAPTWPSRSSSPGGPFWPRH